MARFLPKGIFGATFLTQRVLPDVTGALPKAWAHDPLFKWQEGVVVTIRQHAWCVPLTALACALPAVADLDQMGYNALLDRLGNDAPTGASVGVAQVEAPTGNGNYSPNQGSSHFTGKNFTEMSGSTGVSSHAQNVAVPMYSGTSSMAHGVEDIWLYEASNWLTGGFLRTSAPVPPLSPPASVRVFNHSWVGNVDDFDDEVLRRADWATNEFDILVIGGVANSGTSGPPLMSHNFNGLAVGRTSGSHATGATADGFDGPGRQKPEIVAPAGTTSSATPRVTAAATLLFDTAQTDPSLSSNPNASSPDLLKAALLAGATHSNDHGDSWTNNPIESGPQRGIANQPLDDTVGAGTVNIDTSHLILTGGQQSASSTVPASASADMAGWDRPQINAGNSAYWRFHVSEQAAEASFVITWNRQVSSNFNSYTLAHLELELWEADGGQVSSLVGDDGLGVFASGNVVSQSDIDNIQHLYLTDLAAGEYVLEARRTDGLSAGWDVAAAWYIDADEAILGDLNGDGKVGGADLGILLAAWGDCPDPGDCPADLNGDGQVGGADLGILLANWTN